MDTIENNKLIAESWREIEGYQGLYKISDLGNVIRMPTGKRKGGGLSPYNGRYI